MRAGAFVEVVYVLSAEVEVLAEALFDFCESFMGGVGLCGQGVPATLGVEAPDEGWIFLPGLGGGYFFDAMTVPETTAAAEGGEAAFGGDTGSCENEEAVLGSQVHGEEYCRFDCGLQNMKARRAASCGSSDCCRSS
jgi:hypothetical protein